MSQIVEIGDIKRESTWCSAGLYALCPHSKSCKQINWIKPGEDASAVPKKTKYIQLDEPAYLIKVEALGCQPAYLIKVEALGCHTNNPEVRWILLGYELPEPEPVPEPASVDDTPKLTRWQRFLVWLGLRSRLPPMRALP